MARSLSVRQSLKDHALLAALAIAALAIRVAVVLQIQQTPIFHGLAMDSEGYHRFALELLRGNLAHEDAIYFNPLYPFFLASTYLVFGHYHAIVLVIQAVIDSVSCVLVYYLGSSYFSRRIGLTAALIYGGYGTAIFYSGILVGTSLAVFLSLLSVASLVFAGKRKGLALFCLSGMVFGLTVLARANLILFGLLLPLWFFKGFGGEVARRRQLAALCLYFVGFLLVTAPMGVRTYAIQNRFFPFSVQGGINFYIGNNPEAKGQFMSPRGFSMAPMEQVRTSIRFAEKDTGTKLTPAEASRYWFLEGLRYIQARPLEAAMLYIKKLVLFWRAEELPLNINYPLSRGLVPILQFPFFSFGLVSPLAMIGLALSLRRPTQGLLSHLFVFAGMVSVVIFFISARYRLPVVPFLIVYAACGFWWIVEKIGTRQWKAATISLTLLLFLVAGVNKEAKSLVNPEQGRKSHLNNVGLAYVRSGDMEHGLKELKEALEIDPGFAPTHYNLAVAFQGLGRLRDAAFHYSRALEIDPFHAKAHYNLGLLLAQENRLTEAAMHFRQALEILPDYAEASSNLGVVLLAQGETEEAVQHFKRACTVKPDYVDAHWNLCQAYWFLGDRRGALRALEIVEGLDPKQAKALREWMEASGGN
ncbi:MAG: tetratricopeptide repeat protein [Thermodesulfobacteriota bacterium]|nr:tetratricopeptide repeat protein [Thermodesulfobacteriota bacterium]